MTDDGLVAAVQAIFDAEVPPDGIDRGGGHGDDHRIESLRIVPADDGFDDLEVTVHFRRRLLSHRRNAVSRLLFDRTWRETSDLVDPIACAAYVVAGWQSAIVDPDAHARDRHRAAAEASVPDADTTWQALFAALRASGAEVIESGDAIEVSDGGDEPVTVHVTPDQWRAFVVECEVDARRDSGEDAAESGDGPAEAYFRLDELIGSRWDDERHIVSFRGGLSQSTRAELPPVRSTMLRDTELPDDEGGGWYAYAPDEDP
ncbi:MAG: hypothetical protein ABWX74_11705 [Aeromicrobium sp.]